MGLLEKIESHSFKKTTGLYAKAKAYEEAGFYFLKWAEAHSISRCGILKASGETFVLIEGKGLDAQTVISSVSARDFWKNKTETGTWKSFVGEQELADFYQLFSDQIVITLKALHVLAAGENLIFFILESENDTFVLPGEAETEQSVLLTASLTPSQVSVKQEDFEKGISISNAHLYILSTKLAVEESVSSLTEEEVKNTAAQTIHKFIFRSCSTLFSSPDRCEDSGKFEIKTAVFSKDEIDEKLLQFHIQQNLVPLLQQSASKVLLLFAGLCPSAKGITAFFMFG